MREPWKQQTLGDICEIYQPKTISAKEMKPDGEYTVFGANGIIGRYDQFNHEQPQLLITCRGATCGSVNISLPKSWITGNAMVVRPRSNELSVRFLEYFFRGACDFSKVITGAAQPQITRQSLAPVKVRFPSLPEQQRIVVLLDEVFAGLATATAHAETNLKKARGLFDSYLNLTFAHKGAGWICRQIGDVATTQYGLSGTLNSDGKGYRIFRMGEVQDGRLVDTGRMKFIDIDSDEFGTYRLCRGDVLFNRTNSSDLVGKTGLFDLEGDYCFASYLVRVKFDPKKMNSRFAAYLMNASEFLTRIRARAARSVNQANINATILRSERMDFPESIADQMKLLTKFDDLAAETRRLEELYRDKGTRIAELKQRILRRAFAGELTALPSQAIGEAAE